MIEVNASKIIEFREITPADRELYNKHWFCESRRGCEGSFANLYLWGEQMIGSYSGRLVVFSRFGEYYTYQYPLYDGDAENAVEAVGAIIADARARGIECRISGVSEEARCAIERAYPGKFSFEARERSFDYVYDINDLALLPGKKYHAKRNHVSGFYRDYPDCRVEPITRENIPAVEKIVHRWYEERGESDYAMEAKAIERALESYEELMLVGLILFVGDEAVAFSIASRMSPDTFDVHFEKALSGVNGAYAVINRELSRYIKDRFTDVRYLDREEDMGIEGLRKAKRSYHPVFMVKKYRACLLESEK